MRDSSIIAALTSLNGRAEIDLGRQKILIIAMRCRIDAIEELLFGRRLSLVMAIALLVVSPKRLMGLLDAIHVRHIGEWNKNG